MIFSSGVRVLTPAYFAVKNTWFPALVSAFCLGVHLIIAPILMPQYQVHGLMLSTIISAALNLSFLLIFYKKFVADFEHKIFLKNLVVYSVLALLTGFVAQIFYVIQNEIPTGSLYLFLNLVVSIMSALVVFTLTGYLFKIKAVHEIFEKVLVKIRR